MFRIYKWKEREVKKIPQFIENDTEIVSRHKQA